MQVGGQLCEPRPDRPVVAQPVELLEDLAEDVLEHVLGVGRCEPEALDADRVDVARETLDQGVPCLSTPLAAVGDDLRIRPRLSCPLHEQNVQRP